MEESLEQLKAGRPVPMLYETRFLINWPEHLGGGSVTIGFEGSMTLLPVMGVR